ncbi:MAG: sodium:calcium antiporter [Thermodesulfobacteriaceae bacterium]|nr:sodium:calcium antiporter [Thermodesulfobacteriaceae bacterium]MDW8135798.1 sodium:calcium antiporter [Thermodesulfobacterium sp.]
MEFLLLILSLFLIFISSELFTNGIENLGEKLSLSQAVVGSILASLGTALPETVIPLVAILFHEGERGTEIGTGAILGAPFMLSTIGFFLISLGVITGYFLKTRKKFEVHLEFTTFKRNFSFFLFSYSLAIFLPLLFPKIFFLNYLLALFLIFTYLFYLRQTFRAKSSNLELEEELHFLKFLNFLFSKKLNSKSLFLSLACFQTILALILLLKGADLFVENLETLSLKWGLDPLLFSLLIAPIATELPEKFNSLLWTLKGKDILAFGNIVGAMVFQTTFPVSIGLIFTPWEIKGLALVAAIITILLNLFYLWFLKTFNKISPYVLFLSGFSYIIYVVLIIYKFEF